MAVKLILGQKNLPVAIECLKKLANYNLDSLSHDWKLFNIPIPIMTMKQRVDELQKRISKSDIYYK